MHYNDVIMGTSLTIVYPIVYSDAERCITSYTMKCVVSVSVVRLFTQAFIHTQIKENDKAPRRWPLCGEFTGDRWIPRTNGQLRGKCSHLMTSSYSNYISNDVWLLIHRGKLVFHWFSMEKICNCCYLWLGFWVEYWSLISQWENALKSVTTKPYVCDMVPIDPLTFPIWNLI